MTWSARIEHTPAGLALTFGAPLSRLDMAPDVAEHLASLLAVEARHWMRGVVAAVAKTQGVRHGDTLDIAEIPGSIGQHPLCCDCSSCLNGDHAHG